MNIRLIPLFTISLMTLATSVLAAEELIPDENLRAAIKETLNKKADETLSEEDLRKVFILDADERGIVSLKGLERCRNLAQLNAAGNRISDLSQLTELKNVQFLDLAQNQIRDVSPIAGLEKLQYLKLDHNQISNLKICFAPSR